ncbi:UDP-4-amino-4,6-dideoxy-N-acetyl-beta-L-altrosamine N-acetyltransferase [Aurantimonas sp. VKM B-3413]|uniref:UDP-4-amino-4, 6-dideoxy-N-acetyl-beta-L-altrosamine N-acetyltransferase n=1 Tax=Aurantimonas sp. VKM B-3413 TaxID=2779401 RepID=UPI001E392A3B|nr:UDP-4-amino-4,6-dideoxy-N-acetyl-beta-L-altrosamine N-acetyltransferase [Aurantimonas sp. VKM B-3413]MCB8838608.1 UDP-4-amino-4,6-dideoxy-N-acetyl-beta-L-altrosamine N-acetyltransferase [Aurantimonas sp. VKM B-3413]
MSATQQTYVLRPVGSLDAGQREDLRRIRNSQSVRAAMYQDHVISEDEHRAFLERIAAGTGRELYAVLREGSDVVGAASLDAIDPRHRRTDWAFYLGEDARGGVGSALEFCVLDHVFFERGFEKLNCEVLETNARVVAMHKRFGFVEEGFRRAHVLKDGVRIGVHMLGICRAEWEAVRPAAEALLRSRSQPVKVVFDA